MRSPVNNPFSPGADVVPEVWAGRLSETDDWAQRVRPRLISGLPERGRTVLGEAGLGKSTLVRLIAERAARQGDWVTPQVRVPLGADPLKLIASAVLDLADKAGLNSARDRRIRSLLDRVSAVEAIGVALTVDRREGPEPHVALTDLLIEIGVAAVERDVAVLMHIDEIQNVTDDAVLSQLLVSLGDTMAYEFEVAVVGGLVKRHLPIAVYLTGLPDFADMAGAKKGATFARRFDTRILAPIDDDDLTLALRPFVTQGWPVATGAGTAERISMTPRAADRIVELCCGEPFLFQLAGERAWDAGTGHVINDRDVEQGWETAKREANAHVERILARLPDREREFLEAMAGLDPADRTVTGIARAMGFTSGTQAGPTASRLDTIRGIINRGKPHTFRHRAIEAFLTSDWPDL